MQSSVVLLSGAVFVLLILAPTGLALQCWTCASDLPDPRCNDPFNSTIQRGHNGHNLMTHCDAQGTELSHGQYYPNTRSARPVCKKTKQISKEGNLVIVRTCAWQMPDQPVGECINTGSGIDQYRIVYCQTCDHDLCNSATSSAFFPALLSLPILAALRMR